NVPETHVKQLILFGNVNLTTPAVGFCLDQQIDVVFLTQGGRFRGRLNGDGGKSAELRRRQYERALDRSFCLTQARAIVAGKIKNFMAFARRQVDAGVAGREMTLLKRLLESAQRAESIETLLGIEGSASAAHFKLFSACVPQPWQFEKRTAHPPRDAVNAMLSLSYTLLYNRMAAHLNMIGLDPYQGFFHTIRHGHAALASDLIEEFRPLIADTLCLKLLRRKQIKPKEVLRERGEFRMGAEASKVFFAEFERKLNSRRAAEEHGGLNLTYAQIVVRQAHHFARVIKGEERCYVPFTVK
ncbi:MAG: CRISPR-associated endonuclease Cas1, partial [Acidobacteria bacterium]|nr:CRISPR-associated endonuclease Cas1 [Acidobacteriota bacterium]